MQFDPQLEFLCPSGSTNDACETVCESLIVYNDLRWTGVPFGVYSQLASCAPTCESFFTPPVIKSTPRRRATPRLCQEIV